MKHFVRILIAVLIVGITGFGVWFFAFRDKPNEAVFKKMTATLDHLGEVSVAYEYTDGSKTVASEVTGYSNIINKYLNVSLEKNKYLADAKEEGPEDDVYDFYSDEIENIRKNISELNKYDNYSMKAINYYYSLSVNADKVKNRDKKKLVEAADYYINAVNNVVDIVDDSISFYYVKNITDIALDAEKNPVDNAIKDSQRADIMNKDKVLLRNLLVKEDAQTKLYFALREYVEEFVFDGVVPDYKSAMYNIYANQLNIACNEAKADETKFSTNGNLLNGTEGSLTLLENLYQRCIDLETKNLGFIDSDRRAEKFITSYNKLYNANHSNIAYILQIKANEDYSVNAEDKYFKSIMTNANRLGFTAYMLLIENNTSGMVDITKANVCSKFIVNGAAINEAELEDIYNVLYYIVNNLSDIEIKIA